MRSTATEVLEVTVAAAFTETLRVSVAACAETLRVSVYNLLSANFWSSVAQPAATSTIAHAGSSGL
ncbi:MAG TPA: hypothetical protein VMG11_06565 [Steroidobacteraceae bacterium]|nr:hypothetical protein [Steroidobacteraceae bacterium]